MLHAAFDGPHALGIGHGGRLAGGAADDDGVRPVLKLEVQQMPQRFQVYCFLVEWRDDGNAAAGKEWGFHNRSLLLFM